MTNRIVETPDGFDVIIGAKRHGTWRSRGEAKAGMEVELRRAVQKAERDLNWAENVGPVEMQRLALVYRAAFRDLQDHCAGRISLPADELFT
jgi:hypothetical protein